MLYDNIHIYEYIYICLQQRIRLIQQRYAITCIFPYLTYINSLESLIMDFFQYYRHNKHKSVLLDIEQGLNII